MNISDIDNNHHPLLSPIPVLLVLVLLMMTGSAIGSGLTYLLGQQWNMALVDLITSFDKDSPLAERNFIRLANLLSHLFTFVIPALVAVMLLYRSGWIRFLKFHRWPDFNMLLMGIFFLFSIFVLSQAALWINQQLPLPDWAHDMENSADRMIKGLLVMDSTGELILTVIVIAALPALGEELIFRGILQQKLEEATRNPIAAIWLAGFIFSAFHLQFAGLIPRFFLGVGLGYLFYWTQSLWTPIIAHFFINASQIAGQYLLEEEAQESGIDGINWPATAIAAIMVAGLSYYLYRQYRIRVKPTLLEQNPEN